MFHFLFNVLFISKSGTTQQHATDLFINIISNQRICDQLTEWVHLMNYLSKKIAWSIQFLILIFISIIKKTITEMFQLLIVLYRWKINRIIYYKVIHFYKVFTSASMPATCFKHSYSIVTESQSSLFYLFLYVTDEVLLLIKSISKSNDNIAGARAFVEFFLCAEVKKTHLQPPIRQSHLPGSFNWLGIHFSTRKILFFFQLDSNCH